MNDFYEKVHPMFDGVDLGDNKRLIDLCADLDQWVMIERMLPVIPCQPELRTICPFCKPRMNVAYAAYDKEPAIQKPVIVLLNREVFTFKAIIGRVGSVIYCGKCEKCRHVLWFPFSLEAKMWTPVEYMMKLSSADVPRGTW